MLAGFASGPLRAHGGTLADNWTPSASGVDAQCSTPTVEPSEGRSVHNDVSPPLSSMTPLPAGLPASVYLVPLSPTDACLPSVAAAPVVGTLEPAAGPPGTEVTIRGGGFSPIENAVYLGQGYIPHLSSAAGATLIVVLPAR